MISALSFLRRFGANRCGVSAVEFGLIAPILAVLVLGVAELGHVTYQRTDMHSAVRSGAQYVLNGGRDVDIAQEIVERSWSSMPDDGAVEATRFCLCGASQHACNTPCSDNSVPEAYIRLRATGTLGGIAYETGHSADDSIRIR